MSQMTQMNFLPSTVYPPTPDLADGVAFICLATSVVQLAFLKRHKKMTGHHALACYTAICIYGALMIANMCLLRAIKFEYLQTGRLIVVAFLAAALGLVCLLVADILVPVFQTGKTDIAPSLLSIAYRCLAAVMFFFDAAEYLELERYGLKSFSEVGRFPMATVVMLTWCWLFLLVQLDEKDLWECFSAV